jgi:hypothetical protein
MNPRVIDASPEETDGCRHGVNVLKHPLIERVATMQVPRRGTHYRDDGVIIASHLLARLP